MATGQRPSEVVTSPSPGRRAWLRFKRNRLGYWSLLIFACLVGLSLMAELISNDRPLLVRYEGSRERYDIQGVLVEVGGTTAAPTYIEV